MKELLNEIDHSDHVQWDIIQMKLPVVFAEFKKHFDEPNYHLFLLPSHKGYLAYFESSEGGFINSKKWDDRRLYDWFDDIGFPIWISEEKCNGYKSRRHAEAAEFTAMLEKLNKIWNNPSPH